MSSHQHQVTYPPLNTLKSVAQDAWLVDGSLIRFGPPGLKMPFPTRMTIIRIGASDLFIHSPTMLTPELKAEVANLGRPRWLIAPNRLHYWWVPDWKEAFPDTAVYLAPPGIGGVGAGDAVAGNGDIGDGDAAGDEVEQADILDHQIGGLCALPLRYRAGEEGLRLIICHAARMVVLAPEDKEGVR